MIRQLPPPLTLSLLATLAGCSFGMSGGPSSSWTPQQQPRCSLNSGAAVIDTVVSVASLGLAAVAVADRESCDNSDPFCELGNAGTDAIISMGVITGAVYGIAALTGWNKVSSCRKAHESHLQFRARGPITGPPGSVRAPISNAAQQTDECRRWRAALFNERNPEERRRIAQRMPASCH